MKVLTGLSKRASNASSLEPEPELKPLLLEQVARRGRRGGGGGGGGGKR